jgi:hypothetical protein
MENGIAENESLKTALDLLQDFRRTRVHNQPYSEELVYELGRAVALCGRTGVMKASGVGWHRLGEAEDFFKKKSSSNESPERKRQTNLKVSKKDSCNNSVTFTQLIPISNETNSSVPNTLLEVSFPNGVSLRVHSSNEAVFTFLGNSLCAPFQLERT